MRTAIAAATCVLATASLAAGASDALKCHPDLKGTRNFTVNGTVTSYGFRHGRVHIESTRAPSAVRLQVRTKLVAAQGNRIVRVVLAPRRADAPDRLVVFDRATHRRLASWPLFERPDRVALYGDIAILSSAKRHALDALRITDGRIAMLGIARAGDAPVIGSAGVLYQDDLDLAMHRAAPHRVTLKLLPLSTVRRELRATGARRVGTSRINAISMDGKRVAFVVHDPQGRCDKVLFWSIPWHFVSRLTQKVGPTCLPTHAGGGITDVAIAGDRAVWTTQYGGNTRILGASIIDCVEWVLARPSATRVAGLAGDGGVLAFALRGKASTVGLVPGHWQTVPISRSASAVTGISAYGRRVAVLHSDGTVTIVTRSGHVVTRLFVGAAQRITYQGDTLAVLGKGDLATFDTVSGRRLGRWRVPAGARSVDLQYGIALVAAGHDVVALNTLTGRRTTIFHAPSRVATQIEEPGAVVQFNVGERGYLRFVPMSVIEARTR